MSYVGRAGILIMNPTLQSAVTLCAALSCLLYSRGIPYDYLLVHVLSSFADLLSKHNIVLTSILRNLCVCDLYKNGSEKREFI